MPPLVDADATTSSAKNEPSKQDPRQRKGVLRPEGRFDVEAQPSTSAKSSDAQSLADVYCSSYPAYVSSNSYSWGSQVAYGSSGGTRYIWTARVSVPAFQAPGSTYYEITPEGAGILRDYWNRGPVCTDPPAPDPDPEPVYYPPTVEDAFPVDEMLVDSLTPLLVSHARSNNGGSTIKYTFKVCDNADMTGTACFTSGQLASNVNTWRVPADKLVWGKEYWWTIAALDSAYSLTTTTPALSFTTGVRQPAITSQLASSGVNGQEFHQLPGNYTTSFTDATVAAAGPPLSIVRSYNSMDPRKDGMFGAGWSTRFDMKIQPETVAAVPTLLLTHPDGRHVRFAAKGDGSYQPPPGMYATLVQTFRDVCQVQQCVKEPSGWRLMDKSSTTYLFDTLGKLTTITDNLGRAQQFAYDDSGKLTSVTSPGGRSLSFTWNGAHVASVSTQPVDGRALTWTYVYEGDQLKQVCSPVQAPNCVSFDYTDGSLYRSAVLNSDPIGYWRLGEASGSQAADLGWGAGPATYKSATLKQPGVLAGTGDTAVSLSGTQGVGLPGHALARVEGAASFETWFKTTQAGALLSVGTSADTKSALVYVGTDGKLRGQLRRVGSGGTAGISPITSANTVNDGQWHHVVMTLSGSEQRMYLDGAQAGTLAQPTTVGWPSQADVGLGTIVGGQWPATPGTAGAQTTFGLKGQVDEVAVYAKPLTPEDVRLHYEARLAVPYKLAKITLPSGRVWMSNTYDPATDRLKTHTDANGGTWQIGAPEYTASTGLSKVTVTDPDNNTLVSTYDAWRGYRIVSEADQLGKLTKYSYDTGGYLSETVDPNGNKVTLANDKRGNVFGRNVCRTAQSCFWEWFNYYLNESNPVDPRNDRMVAHLDARSSGFLDETYATRWWLLDNGLVEAETWPNVAGDSWWGKRQDYTNGTEPAIGGGTMPAGLVKGRFNWHNGRHREYRYAYTAAGDLAEETSPTGLKTVYTHDALGRVTSRTKVSASHPDGVKTTFTYDALSRVLTQTGPGARNEITDVTHTAQARLVYDADGNKESETLADLTGGDTARTATYGYDPLGRLETITGPGGGVSKQEWSKMGTLVRTIDAAGTAIEHIYSKRGELLSRTLKGWTGSPVVPQPAKDVVLESFAYDPAGRLATQSDAMGRKTSYTYFGDNLPSQVIADDVKLNGSTSTRDVILKDTTYDPAGNVLKTVSSGIATTEVTVDAANRVTSTLFDPAGLKRKTSYEYDAVNNPIKVSRSGGGDSRVETTEFSYNALGIKTRQTIENGDQDLTTTWKVDDRGLVTELTDPRGNAAGATAADFTTTIRYDALGRAMETTGPQVKVDKAGATTTTRPTTRAGYDTFGAQTHTLDAEGRRISTTFDKAGRATQQTAPSYTPPGGTAITPTIVHAYDPAGRLTSTTDPRGNVTSYDYDQLGRQVRTTDPTPNGQTAGTWVTEYDLAGEKVASIDPTGARSQATYDDLGRQITATQIERKPSTASYITKLEYDDAGQLVKQTAPAPGSGVTSFTVNAAGETTSTTDPLLKKTTMAHDLAGRLTKTTDPNGNATTADYDLAGRKTTVKDLDDTGAVLRTYSVGYDLAGNQTSATSPEGHITRQTFDALGQLTSRIEPVSADESITTTFGYDASGARTRITDGRGNATWTSYNTLGLPETLTESATTAHPDVADRSWTQLYDAAGNQTATIQPGGVRIDRTFDQLNQLTKETGAGGGAASAERTLGYDLAGRMTSAGDLTVDLNDRGLPLKVTRGTVQETAYAYDALGNPTQRVDAAGTAAFTWDNANRLATATDPVTARTLTYGYDSASRLKTITATSGTAGTQTIDYDNMNRVTGQTLKNGSGTQIAKIGYGWDKDDNLTTKTTVGTAGAGTNTYSYDQAGRLTSWSSPGGAVTNYEWDAAGNRTKAGSTTFTYDERNRLTSGDGTDYSYTPRGTLASQTKTATTTSYTYDAFNRMIADGDSLYAYDALDRTVSRIRGTAKQTFAYSGLGNDLAAITDSSGTAQAKYARDAKGALLGIKEGASAAVAALSDLHGDLIATYTATLQTSTAYDPFGIVTAQTGTKAQLGYQGEYTDPDTGKVNMHARWYQPGTGTFASRDTATLDPTPSVQANRYTYANASPLTRTDPTGHAAASTGFEYGSGGYSGNLCNDSIDAFKATYCRGAGGSGGKTIGDGFGGSGGGVACAGPAYNYCGAVDYNVTLALPESELKKRNILPNGMQAMDGFWTVEKKIRQEIIDFVYDGAPEEDVRALWKALWSFALPSGGDGKKVTRLQVTRALKATYELDQRLSSCYQQMQTDKCKQEVRYKWLEWRDLFCRGEVGDGPCQLSDVGTIVGNGGIGRRLVLFLVNADPTWSSKTFEKKLIAWATKEHGTCEKHAATGLTVCSGLTKGLHFGRGGTTLGNVTLTGYDSQGNRRSPDWFDKNQPEFLRHEAEHREQWYHYYNITKFWPTYLVLYLDQPIEACDNLFEQQAEKKGNTYDC
ncbi:RHS repeat-associated core domain-containing protein [Nonomuraea sp. NPDC049607]|uniref:RHS repeat-associated core domain-containing protein n=1 Tax=Nonomuraea sp. NPDC049607 TaxID=3154732 RepID=UPI0034361FCA